MSQKISIERDDIKFEATIPWDADINEVMEAFKACMIGMTWSPETIDNWIVEEAACILEERQEDDLKHKLN